MAFSLHVPIMLTEGQWYQLPSSVWCRATHVTDPLGPILEVYGIDLAGSDSYRSIFYISVLKDGYTLGATGLCTWETWTLADLREATPDEAEAQDYRCLGVALNAVREGS